ncbi:MAG: M14 family metallocarboxypeptidase [Luteolibacter sp.]
MELPGAAESTMFPEVNADLQWPEFIHTFSREVAAAGFHPEILAELDAGPLMAWERPADGPRVYLSAGIHGDEPAGPLALLELLRIGFFSPEIHWLLCPALNPAGLAACRRENACDIDLNRDYWIRSTAEVVAHSGWLDSRGAPDLFISLHEDWESCGFYFYEINLREDEPERAREIIAATQPWFHPEPGPVIDGHQSREPGWIYHAAEPDLPEGWPEAIYLAKQGCPLSFTFETPSHAKLSSRVAAHVAAVKAACGCVLDEIG